MRPGAALHDGRRAHQPHRREPDAEGPVRGRRGGVLGHARLQPARRQLGRRNRRRRHDRRRVHRRLLRPARERRRHPDRRSSTSSCGASRRSSTRSSTGAAPRTPSAIKARMQEIMTGKVGIFRSGEDLAGGGRRAAAAARAEPQHRPARSSARGANPELVTAYRVQKMLKLALCVAYGALTRTESRGAHFRAGLPAPQRRRVAEAHARHVEGRRRHAADARLRGARRRTRWSCRPGWRGYGAKDYVDHPDTPKRAAEVDALKQKMAARRASRVQEALMPYEHAAARALRGRNERIDEPLPTDAVEAENERPTSRQETIARPHGASQ